MKLTVLQWNVWYQEKADNILNLIKEVDADVVCLQELTHHSGYNPGRDIPSEISQSGYSHFYYPTIKNDGMVMGNGIFSKLPIEKTRFFHVREEDIPENHNKLDPFHETRAYIEITAAVDKADPITIGTVHLSFTPRFTYDAVKEGEVDRLLSCIDSSRRYLLTGDLNSLPDSETVKKLDRALVPAGPEYNQATWTTKRYEFPDFTADGLNWRLDYVYTTPDVKVLSAKTIPTEFSDHLPILTELELKD